MAIMMKEMNMVEEFRKITDFLLDIWQGKESKWLFTISLGRFPCVYIQHIDYPNATVIYAWDVFPYNANIIARDMCEAKEKVDTEV